jgi:hypothetical protein
MLDPLRPTLPPPPSLPSRRLLLLLLFLPLPLTTIGCRSWDDGTPPPGGDDDDDFSAGDDDSTAGDDDSTAGDDDDDVTDSPETASYPEEETFFALASGNTWRYVETVSTDAEPLVDDVLVTVLARLAGPDLEPGWPQSYVAFLLDVDRIFGNDSQHWYALDGTNRVRWLKTRIYDDFFEYEDFEGDGSTVYEVVDPKDEEIDRDFDVGWYLEDVDNANWSANCCTPETFFYDEGNREAETLGSRVFEGGDELGFQYFKPEWGLLGMDLEIEGSGVSWDVIECSACPEEAGF